MKIFRSPAFEVPEFYVDQGRRWINHVLSVGSSGALEVLTHPVSEACSVCEEGWEKEERIAQVLNEMAHEVLARGYVQLSDKARWTAAILDAVQEDA